MMAYFKFNIKKLFRNRMYLSLLLIPIALSLIALSLNNSTDKTMNYITETQENIDHLNNELKIATESGDSKNASTLTDLLHMSTAFLDDVNNKDWSAAYTKKVSLLNEDLNTLQNSIQYAPEDLLASVQRDKEIYSYLAKHNIEHQNTDFAYHGFDFLLWIFNLIIPFVLTLIFIFGLSQLFTDKYKNKLDTSFMLPSTNLAKIASELCAGLFYVTLSLGIILTLNFIISTSLSGTGSLIYPYAIVTKNTVTLTPLWHLLLQTLALQCLVFIFIICLVFLISSYVKTNMITAFISSAIILGYQLLLGYIEPIQKIAAYVPLTYLNSINIVTNQVNVQTQQTNISYDFGIPVLIISIFLILILILIKNKTSNIVSALLQKNNSSTL